MQSLFWKIFISFWLALILFAGLSLWATSHYLEKARSEARESQPRHDYVRYIQQARHIARSGDMQALHDWLTELDRRETIPYLLLDETGRDMLNRPVPLRLQQRVLNQQRRDNEHKEEHDAHRHHRREIIINNQRYILVADFRNVTLNRILNRPRIIATPILFAALISAIVCLLLARYLAAPIGRLRQATQKLAQGDLEQRVSPSMGKRKDEIVDLANDFDHMAEQLQALVVSHKQLLRDASHELRSPLARLQVALGLARKNDIHNSKELDCIERETERLNDLIGQLLSLARLETSSIEIDKAPLALDQLLEDIASDASYEAKANNRSVNIIHSQPVTIYANSLLLSSALENVVRNAIRHTDEDTTVELSLEQKNDLIIIQVRDYGSGIPETMLKSIFQPFVRVSEARDRQSGGYGLGLAIAQRAIHLHHGEMEARNETSGGMSIIIRLPSISNNN